LASIKLEKGSSIKVINSLDERIKNLVKTKDDIERKENQLKDFNPVTKEDLEKLNFVDDLGKIKEIQREKVLEDLSLLLNEKIKEVEQKDKENKEKEQVLTDLTSALNEKIKQLETSNLQLKQEKKHSDDLNEQLKTTLKKLSDAEIHLKVERDWLAEQVEKKSLEVLQTIEQLMKAENAKS
jgi:hypothetical protein